MKKVAVIGVHVVGMHHWGGRELRVGEIYFARNEPLNPKDKNAVAVYSDTECIIKRGYLCREDALIISKLFEENLICDNCFLKPKGVAEKFKKHRGPLQRCNVGFFSAEENINRIGEILHKYEMKVW